MKSSQHTFRKVKLRIKQPDIMCHIRKNIECTYRGKVTEENDTEMQIEFKTHGKTVVAKYDKMKKKFIDPMYEDIEII